MKQYGKSILIGALCTVLLTGCTSTPTPLPTNSMSQESSSQLPEQSMSEQVNSMTTDSIIGNESSSKDSSESSSEQIDSNNPSPSLPSFSGSESSEEKALFLQFWQDSNFDNNVNEPCGKDFSQYQESYWIIASEYLQNRDVSQKQETLYTADNVAYYPVEDFIGVLQAMFGENVDYASLLPDEVGPKDGTLCVANGYGANYLFASLDPDSFILQDDELKIQAALQWREPGYTKEMGTLIYTFAVQPENPYCRYRLTSLDGENVPF